MNPKRLRATQTQGTEIKQYVTSWLEQIACPVCHGPVRVDAPATTSPRYYAVSVQAYCTCGNYRARIDLSTCRMSLLDQEAFLSRTPGATKTHITRELERTALESSPASTA